jgi:two-component system response regulator PilR (NtrC family)
MFGIYDLIKRVAPTKTNVLIMGESGTGKELAAKAIHFNSPRRDRPFVTVNCGAIPENLIESELFGHKKGSFTGAVVDTRGLFAVADGGTLFLDEVGELPFQIQVKLLHAIQERRFLPIGSTNPIEVDVRIISATNKDLENEVANAQFREDLFYRLNVISFRMPPLREHPEDIPMLAEYFLEKHCKEQGKELKGISQEAMSVLEQYRFPGNVRELENIIERAVALERTGVILLESLPQKIVQAVMGEKPAEVHVLQAGGEIDLGNALEDFERNLLIQALQKAGGIKMKAAKMLNITFRSLRYRLEKLGLDSSSEKPLEDDEEGQ